MTMTQIIDLIYSGSHWNLIRDVCNFVFARFSFQLHSDGRQLCKTNAYLHLTVYLMCLRGYRLILKKKLFLKIKLVHLQSNM